MSSSATAEADFSLQRTGESDLKSISHPSFPFRLQIGASKLASHVYRPWSCGGLEPCMKMDTLIPSRSQSIEIRRSRQNLAGNKWRDPRKQEKKQIGGFWRTSPYMSFSLAIASCVLYRDTSKGVFFSILPNGLWRIATCAAAGGRGGTIL